MHEMGIAMQIIQIAVESIPKDLAAPRVEKIHLKIGQMSGVVPESLTFCFDIASQDTILKGATLVIASVPIVIRCNACAHQWNIQSPVFTCEKCGGADIAIQSGQELDIVSLELAD